MEFKKNPVLAEKPNHAHYPVCRGRLDEINKISYKTFYYTIGASLIMGLLSMMRVPLNVVGWIPMIFTMEENQAFNMSFGFSLTQFIMCLVFCFISALGCSKQKQFTVITFVLYLLMFVSSLFNIFSMFDMITGLLGFIGMCVSFLSLTAYKDFKQLEKTEGFPIFSTILADYEDQKKKNPNGFSKRHFDQLMREKLKNERNTHDVSNLNGGSQQQGISDFSKPQSADTDDIGEMPELSVKPIVRTEAVYKKFVPKDRKEVYFSDSPLKLK